MQMAIPPEQPHLVSEATPYPHEADLGHGFLHRDAKGEILGLTWDRVGLKNRVIRLEAEHTKDAEARNVPILDPRYDVLYMRKAGVPQHVIMEITGHSTDEIFRRYDTIDGDDKLEAAKRLQDFLANVYQAPDQGHSGVCAPTKKNPETVNDSGVFPLWCRRGDSNSYRLAPTGP